MARAVLTQVRIFDGEQIREGQSVVIDDGWIVEVTAGRVEGSAAIACDNALLAPGFIDLQVNGGGGVLFNATPTVDAIRRIGAAHRRFGTTGFLPTLISDDQAAMGAAREAVDAAFAQKVPGVLGIHLEGPFLNPVRKGAHNAAHIRVPTADDMVGLRAPHAGKILLTLAPEVVPAEDIAALAAAGLILFAGHTDATFEQMAAALDGGICGLTHLFNAMSPLTARKPGAVGAALASIDSWCGIIADGLHVHPASLRLAIRSKPGRVFFVTDAMAPVGIETKSFVLGGQRVVREGDRLSLEDGTLAGSCLDMAGAVRYGVAELGLSLEEALRMASLYPASVLGLDRERGRIAADYRADLVLLDNGLRVVETWIAGEGSGRLTATG